MSIAWVGTTHAVIDAPGDYVIDRDRTQTTLGDSAIIVLPNTPYVTIRLRSRLVNAGGSASTNCGIQATNCDAMTIIGEGGSIYGFGYGIRTEDCDGLVIKDVSVLSALAVGIKASGSGLNIDRNAVGQVAGTTIAAAFRTFGISARGADIKLLRNSVGDVVATGDEEAVLLSIDDCSANGLIAYNIAKFDQVRNKQFGIWVGQPAYVDVLYNYIRNAKTGLALSDGDGYHDHNSFRGCTLAIEPNVVLAGPNNSIV